MNWKLLAKIAIGMMLPLTLAVIAIVSRYPNTMRQCHSLEFGASELDLIDAVGKPIGNEIADGTLWTTYPHPLASATPILARIDPKTNRIISLWCDQANRQRIW